MIPKQLHEPQYRFIMVRPNDKRPVNMKWTLRNFGYNHEELADHFKAGGNYGVVTGYGGLLVVDFDDIEYQNAVWEQLPRTFTVKTGSGGLHAYYKVDDARKSTKVMSSDGSTLADIQARGKMVVGPGSTHPNGEKYEVLVNAPITEITRERLDSILGLNQGSARVNKLIKCPYHDDKNASLATYEDNTFYCFGCHASGTMEALNNPEQAQNKPNKSGGKHYYIPKKDDMQKTQYEVLTPQELLERGSEEIEWVVKNIVPRQGIVIFGGEPGSYKSALALTLALQAGVKQAFLEKFTTIKTKTLFIDMEAGVRGLSLRLRQLMSGHRIEHAELMFMSDQPITLDYPAVAVEALTPIIEEHKIDLVIIDAVVRAMLNEENSASDVRKVFSTLQQLRDKLEVSFILIHHLSKGNHKVTLESLRGSGDFGAMADAAWGLKQNGQGYVTMSCLKHRYLPLHQLQDIRIKVENVEGELGKIYFNYQGVKEKPLSAPESALKGILHWVAKNNIKEFSQKQACDALKMMGHSPSAVKEAIYKLKECGEVFQPRARQPYQINTLLTEVEELEE